MSRLPLFDDRATELLFASDGASPFTVLIVETRLEDRRTIDGDSRSIFSEETAIRVAATAREGLELYRSLHSNIVLLGYRVPDPAAGEFLETLAGEDLDRPSPIVLLTEREDEPIVPAALKAGAIDYLVKNRLAPETLRSAIARALARGRSDRSPSRDDNEPNGCRRVEEELRRSRETLREQRSEIESIYRTAPVGLCSHDLELRFVRVNERLAEINGLPVSEHIGRTPSELLPELGERVERVCRQVIRSGEPLQNLAIEGTTPSRPGAPRHWLASYYPSRDGNGRVSGVNVVVQEMTEREDLKRTEEQLQESQRILDALMESIPEGIAIAEAPDGTIRRVSRYGQRLTGRSPESLEGIPVERYLERWDLLRPDGSRPNDGDLPLVRALRRGEVTFGEEWILRRPDNPPVRVSCNAAPILDRHGQVTGGIVAWRDITERKAIEERLRESERFLKEINEAAPNLLYIFDLVERRNVYIGPQIFPLLGFSIEAIRSSSSWVLTELFHPDDLPRIEEHHDRIRGAREDGIFTIEYRMRHADGGWRWLTSRDTIFARDERGNPVQILGSAIDITERKLAEERSRESEEKLSPFIRHAPAAMAMFDRQMRYLAHSQRWLEDCQLSGNVIGRSHYEVFPDLPESWRQVHRNCLADAVERSGGERFERADGSIYWVKWESRPWFDAAGSIGGIVIFSENITDRVRAELRLERQADELRALNAALERTAAELIERNRELDRFVYTVSHDLKAPLRAIANLAGWLTDDLGGRLEGDNLHHLELLGERVSRMVSLIDGLLAYSRVGRGEIRSEMVNTRELLDEAIDSLAPPASFAVSIPPDMPVFVTKRLLLSQVFANLIGNALKYGDRPDGRIEIRARRREGYYEFSVSDNGPGIAPEDRERVFDLFQTLGGKSAGTGIGLAIVKKIVESEGGDISVESELGNGATFRFTWPAE
ncbi:PAS domain S-box protein [Pannus brasiliensis CCIBt3594]|uniref:histidine kinase n=1 Tax=Pannus brasiliensis CCIBt3594 TaxID=1427578 RepID=A0AAW9QPL0_9CHRO